MFPITITVHTPDQLTAVLAALQPGVEPSAPAPEAKTEAAPEKPKKRGRPKKTEAAETASETTPDPTPAQAADPDLPAAATEPAVNAATVEEYRRKLMVIVGKVGPAPVLKLVHKRAPELVKVPPAQLPALLAEAEALLA